MHTLEEYLKRPVGLNLKTYGEDEKIGSLVIPSKQGDDIDEIAEKIAEWSFKNPGISLNYIRYGEGYEN